MTVMIVPLMKHSETLCMCQGLLLGPSHTLRASLAAKVKNWPLMKETQVRFMRQEDPLEKEMTTHSSILAWRIPWTEEPGRLQSMEWQRVGHD